MAQRISATATVEQVDAQNHQLTLRDDDGNQLTVDVPQRMTLEHVHQGDRIKIDYYEAIGVSLKKGAAGAPSRTGETTITKRNAGTLPSGVVMHRISGTVEVLRVDRVHHRLTVRRPDGSIDTIDVTDPAMQVELANLHEGDRIQATYTEAAAITVVREGASRPGRQQPTEL